MEISKQTKQAILSALQILFVFTLSFGIASYFSFIGVDPHHDGIMLKPASDIAHGQMLFRDTFTQYGAFASLLQAWALLIFGNYLVVIKLLTAAFYGFVVVLLWLIWRIFLPEGLATLACIILIFLSPFHEPNLVFFTWSSVYSLFFQMVALFSLLRLLKTKKFRWQILAGVSSALTFWSRQPVGFLLVIGVIFFVLLMKFKKHTIPSFKYFFISLFGTHAVFFSWILINHALSDWYYQTIRFPSIWVTSASQNPIVLFMNFCANMFPQSYSPFSIWTLMPLVALYMGYINFRKKKITVNESSIILVSIVCLASWLQYHPVSDTHHQWWAMSPMIGFALYFALSFGFRFSRKFLYLVICLLLFFPDIAYHVRLARRKIRISSSYQTITKPIVLKGMRVPPKEKLFYEEATTRLSIFEKTHPGSFAVTNIDQALYPLFDGKNTNCYKITVNWNWKIYDPQLEKKYSKAMNDCIQKFKPAIFTHRSQIIPAGYYRATKGESLRNVFLLLPRN